MIQKILTRVKDMIELCSSPDMKIMYPVLRDLSRDQIEAIVMKATCSQNNSGLPGHGFMVKTNVFIGNTLSAPAPNYIVNLIYEEIPIFTDYYLRWKKKKAVKVHGIKVLFEKENVFEDIIFDFLHNRILIGKSGKEKKDYGKFVKGNTTYTKKGLCLIFAALMINQEKKLEQFSMDDKLFIKYFNIAYEYIFKSRDIMAESDIEEGTDYDNVKSYVKKIMKKSGIRKLNIEDKTIAICKKIRRK